MIEILKLTNRNYKKQKDLRILRNQYLHWLADNGSLGMEPMKDKKRKVF